MRNLINLIIRYHPFLVFILLEFICLYLLFNRYHFQQMAFYQRTQQVAGFFHERLSGFYAFLYLKEDNQRLLSQNALLNRQLLNREISSPPCELPDLEQRVLFEGYRFIPVRVIYNTTSLSNNYISINAGRNQGVKENMAIINDQGIVGMIHSVSDDFAIANSVLNQDFRLNVMIEKLDEIGSLVWSGEDRKKMKLMDIPAHVNIEKGMEVVSGPYTMAFPEGVPVGYISGFELKAGESFYNIDVELATDMKNVRFGYVLYQPTLRQIQKVLKDDFSDE